MTWPRTLRTIFEVTLVKLDFFGDIVEPETEEFEGA
jgi:hypothetical protein